MTPLQAIHEWMAENRPDVINRMTTSPPLWWLVMGGPALASLGSAVGSRWVRRTGFVLSLGTLAAMLDIGRSPAVPGANDNLSGVAALVWLAAALRQRPVPGLRVLLVSAGAEEALQEGIRGFARRHFPRLPTDRTWFVNLDTVGSGRLVLLEAEGPSRYGYPTATLVSLDRRKLIPNYHLHTDVPENVDYECVAMAARLTEAVARRIART